MPANVSIAGGAATPASLAERARAAGDRIYDFLAGDDRYKRSLATGTETLAWAKAARPRSLLGLAARARRAASALRSA